MRIYTFIVDAHFHQQSKALDFIFFNLREIRVVVYFLIVKK